jgi:predicted NBD/HSP70 family sugar kinase
MRTATPTSAPHLRPLNRALALRLLRDHSRLSRSELARAAGVSPTTITKLSAELIEHGWVVETPVDSTSRVGRPAINLALRTDTLVVCGVQIGVGFVRIGACNLFAEVNRAEGFEFDPSLPPEAVIDTVAERVAALMQDAGVDVYSLLGVGVAVPGAVDESHRKNLLAINLGWRDIDFATPLEAALGVPVAVEHNVRAMALAEVRYGAARGEDSVFYVYVRSGVGAGMIVGGEPFRSGAHGACELGHLRIVSDGPRCTCGATGCLETLIAEPALSARVAEAVERQPGGPLAVRLGEHSPLLAALDMAAADGDSGAKAILDDLVEYLTTGLASVVNLLNPDLIVLGGLFADATDITFDRVRERLRGKAFPVLRDTVRVERTALGLDAGMTGAAAFALEEFFYRPSAPPA